MAPSSTHASHENSRDCGAFFLDVVGQFTPQQVKVRWSRLKRAAHADIDQLIEAAWTEEAVKAHRAGRQLFDGELCRLVKYAAAEDTFTLTLGASSYREFLGTNLRHARLRYTHGPEALANPLGVSAAVLTADGFLLLGRRSEAVAWHAGRLHPIGGMVQPAGRRIAPDPFAAMMRELEEETAIAAEHVVQSVCVGLVRDKQIVQPEIVFDVAVSLTAEEIRRKARHAADAAEHTELVPVRDHPASVVTFLEKHARELTPVALATLLLHGQGRWGSGWFATARGYLRNLI
jgi:8-oxo-dGTP pyrophosphatase MutT (NUDIX family)